VYADGVHVIPVTAPVGSVLGQTFARFRISQQGGLTPRGFAPDGEVEDYEVLIEPPPEQFDWGDAPDGDFVPGGYPTLAINNGANHRIVQGLFLGAASTPKATASRRRWPTATT